MKGPRSRRQSCRWWRVLRAPGVLSRLDAPSGSKGKTQGPRQRVSSEAGRVPGREFGFDFLADQLAKLLLSTRRSPPREMRAHRPAVGCLCVCQPGSQASRAPSPQRPANTHQQRGRPRPSRRQLPMRPEASAVPCGTSIPSLKNASGRKETRNWDVGFCEGWQVSWSRNCVHVASQFHERGAIGGFAVHASS